MWQVESVYLYAAIRLDTMIVIAGRCVFGQP